MSRTLERIRRLISEENVQVSEHGYEELAADGLLARELVEGVEAAEIIEDYPCPILKNGDRGLGGGVNE